MPFGLVVSSTANLQTADSPGFFGALSAIWTVEERFIGKPCRLTFFRGGQRVGGEQERRADGLSPPLPCPRLEELNLEGNRITHVEGVATLPPAPPDRIGALGASVGARALPVRWPSFGSWPFAAVRPTTVTHLGQ